MDSVSDHPISFHYVCCSQMYAIELFVYRIRLYRIYPGDPSSEDWNPGDHIDESRWVSPGDPGLRSANQGTISVSSWSSRGFETNMYKPHERRHRWNELHRPLSKKRRHRWIMLGFPEDPGFKSANQGTSSMNHPGSPRRSRFQECEPGDVIDESCWFPWDPGLKSANQETSSMDHAGSSRRSRFQEFEPGERTSSVNLAGCPPEIQMTQSCPRVTFLGPDPTRRNVDPTRPAIANNKSDPTRSDPQPDPSPICIVFNGIIIIFIN